MITSGVFSFSLNQLCFLSVYLPQSYHALTNFSLTNNYMVNLMGDLNV